MTGERPVLHSGHGKPVRRKEKPKVSLGHLIDLQSSQASWSRTALLGAEKAALCRNLSLALVHLASDVWVHDKWSLDNIFLAFKSEGAHGSTLDRERPYLSSCLGDCDPVDSLPSKYEPTAGLVRGRMLSFAQLLMEIYLEERLRLDSLEDGAMFAHLRDLLEDPVVRGSVPAAVIAAVEACLEVFRSEDLEEEPSKDWIFSRIIQKLDENFRVWGLPQRSEPRKWEEKRSIPVRKRRKSLEICKEFSKVRFEIPVPVDEERPERLVFLKPFDVFRCSMF